MKLDPAYFSLFFLRKAELDQVVFEEHNTPYVKYIVTVSEQNKKQAVCFLSIVS